MYAVKWHRTCVMVMVLSFVPMLSSSQTRNHPYPRTAIFQWDGAPDEWYAKFDLVMSRNDRPDWARRVKRINPNVMLLPAKDWNRGSEIPGHQDQWYAVTSQGKRIELYGSDSWFSDLSVLCPRVNGKRYIDFLVDYLSTAIDHTVFDGVATDGIYGREHMTYNLGSGRSIPDIDLDRNGQNDLNEAGKGSSWVINQWQAGIDYLLAELRRRLGPNQIILLNSGTAHAWGWELTNGMVSEHTGGVFDPNFFFNNYRSLMNRAHQPLVSLMNVNAEGRDQERARPSKIYYRHQRFMLGVAMCFDWYYEYEDLESGEHYYNQYYDEFSVKVGYPTSGPQRTRGEVWVRFFDDGAVITNVTGSDVTISDADLRGLSGYNGPYYRFRGGQDPDFNNGESFSQVTLQGHLVTAYGGAQMIAGDGILLTRSPRVVVADIILDDSPGSTTAGGADTEFIGNWTRIEDCRNGINHYTLRCAPWLNLLTHRRAEAGGGEARAVYRPNIGLSGEYEVFEWHGQLGSSNEAVAEGDNVPYRIRHDGGEKTVLVNQRINAGQWNSLGKFNFTRGQDHSVTITNQANGPVIADAIKFVYGGGTPPPNYDPAPAPPRNVRIGN